MPKPPEYDITVAPAQFFVCQHTESHDGPCTPSAFVYGDRACWECPLRDGQPVCDPQVARCPR